MLVAELAWLVGVVLVVSGALGLLFLFKPTIWEHTYCFLAPFVQDNRLNCPTSEAVADEMMKDPSFLGLDGKIAIVTGCTLGGIGAQTAAILAGRFDMTVVCAGRTQSKLDKAVEELTKSYPNAKLVPMVVDVSSLASVRAFVKAFDAKFPTSSDAHHLALLINNAGIMAGPYAKSVDDLELQMATNHLGPFLLTLLLAPRLRATAKKFPKLGSRIINVASMAHALPSPYGSQPIPLNRKYGQKYGAPFFAYGRSKRANVLSAKAFAKHIPDVTSLSLCPGNVKTNLGQNNIIAWLAYELMWFVHKTCTQGTSTTIYAAVEPNLKDHSGSYLIHALPRPTAGCGEDAVEVLWRESLDVVKLTKAELAAALE